MTHGYDDTLLTKYALGEATEAERAVVEARLDAEPDARAEVAAICATAEALTAVLAAEPAPVLAPARRARIERASVKPRGAVLRRCLAAAALLIVCGAGAVQHLKSGPLGRRAKDPELVVRWVTPANRQDVPLEGRVVITFNESLNPDCVTTSVLGEGFEVTSVPDGRGEGFDTESYESIVENAWVRPLGEAALSTFGIDVDTASYAIVRRFLGQEGRRPPRGAVRIEEMVNYFRYDYDGPAGDEPFAVHVDAAAAPWEPRHRLVRIALKAREIPEAERPPANLVFLLDVSGSMEQPVKLSLVKQAMGLLAGKLDGRDRVAIVTYADGTGIALPATTGDRKAEILGAIDCLAAGGSTNGAGGIELAYRVAEENRIEGGVNRVILATDGDFNVGVTNESDLVDLIERKAKGGVFLTALGFGMGNLKDSTLEKLADRGNGNYAYVDSLSEARKVLVTQIGGTLVTVAKDVKIQVEWNPERVAAYRLVGYENRVLAARDFNDDEKDAGEIGAGHTVTAFYEVVPAGEAVPGATVDDLRYQPPPAGTGNAEMLTAKLRFKPPDGDTSVLRELPFTDEGLAFDNAGEDFRFAAAVAEFALLLRDSRHMGSANYDAVKEIAGSSLGRDEGGHRAEFLSLVEKASALPRETPPK